jgi:hypothetical protein
MSYDAIDPALAAALKSIAPPCVLVGHPVIKRGDDDGLLPEDAGSRINTCPARRQQGAPQ